MDSDENREGDQRFPLASIWVPETMNAVRDSHQHRGKAFGLPDEDFGSSQLGEADSGEDRKLMKLESRYQQSMDSILSGRY